LEARAASKLGHSICDFTEPWGEVRGWGRCEIVPHRCQFWYDLNVRHTVSARDWIVFDLAPTSNGVDRCRLLLRCPECGSGKQSLFYKDKWACTSCLGLLFRSQIVPSIAIQFEKLKQLNSFLENGRPHGMHNNTFLKIVSKRNNLEDRLHGIRPIVVSEKYVYHLTNEWRHQRSVDEASFFGPIVDTMVQPERVINRVSESATSPNPSELDRNMMRTYRSGYDTYDPEDL
jgi:hypothetical protein